MGSAVIIVVLTLATFARGRSISSINNRVASTAPRHRLSFLLRCRAPGARCGHAVALREELVSDEPAAAASATDHEHPGRRVFCAHRIRRSWRRRQGSRLRERGAGLAAVRPVELFFDLMAVLAITQFTRQLVGI
jgi:hypothetical protein